MIHTLRPLILPMLLFAPLAAQKTIELVPAGLGGKVDFVHHVAQDQAIETAGQTFDVHQEMWHHFTVTIDGVGAEGVRSVRVTLRRLRGAIQTPATDGLEFDTAAEARDATPGDQVAVAAAALREAVGGLVGAEYTAKIGKDGSLLQSTGLGEKLQQTLQRGKGMEQYLESMLGDRAMSQLVRAAFGRLPKTPVAVGQSWEDVDDTASPMPMVRRMNLTLRSFDDEAADITFDGTITTKGADGKPPATTIEKGKMNGTVTLSRRDGFTFRAEVASSMTLTSKQDGAEYAADIKVASTIEREKPAKNQPPKEPAAPPKDGGR